MTAGHESTTAHHQHRQQQQQQLSERTLSSETAKNLIVK